LRRVSCHCYVVDRYGVRWLGGLTIEFWAVFRGYFLGAVILLGLWGVPIGMTLREAKQIQGSLRCARDDDRVGGIVNGTRRFLSGMPTIETDAKAKADSLRE
jgi:hypothetical protein